MKRWRVVVLAGVVACHTTTSAAPRRPFDPAPPRPKLEAPADSNDPAGYYVRGVSLLPSEPDSAAAHFYWAARLAPWYPDAIYARAIALLAAHGSPVNGSRRPRRLDVEHDPELLRTVDSLLTAATELDPFLEHRLDYVVSYLPSALERQRIRDAETAGYWAFQARDYAAAVEQLGKALRKKPASFGMRFARAQSFYHLKSYDSAAVEIGHLLDSLTARDTSSRRLAPYHSKEMVYYALGMVHTMRDDTVAARRAYQQALTENFGFAMARVRLAGLALAQRDSAEAMRQLADAIEVRPDDVALRFYFGGLLLASGRREAAADQLAHAVARDPEFAPPHEMLGRIAEAFRQPDEALDEYRAFLARAPLGDPRRAWVEQRVATLAVSEPRPPAAAPPHD